MTNNEDRLRRALREAAKPRPTTDADVAAFRERLEALEAEASTGQQEGLSPDREAAVISGDSGGEREHSRRTPPRWRAPLIAAAAVAAIALTVSAAVTGGFGLSGHHAADVPSAATGVSSQPLGAGPLPGSAATIPPGPGDAADVCMKTTGMRPDLAISLPGAGAGAVCFDLVDPASEVRFFDGHAWYVAQPVSGPGENLLRFFGQTTPYPAVHPIFAAPDSDVRLAYGVIGPDAAHIAVSAGVTVIGDPQPIPHTDLRAFLLMAGPTAGTVTISDDAGHQIDAHIPAVGATATSASAAPGSVSGSDAAPDIGAFTGRWVLHTIRTGPAHSASSGAPGTDSRPAPDGATVTWGNDGILSVSACNELRASYRHTDATLTVGDFTTVGEIKPCPSSSNWPQILAGTTQWSAQSVDGIARLTITADDGAALIFERATEGG